MKVIETILSIIVIMLGALPFLGEKFLIPNQGTGYAIVLIAGGVILLIISIANNMLMGMEKFVLAIQCLLLIVIGLINFFPALLPFIPREGIWQSVIIIAGGLMGIAYGFVGIG